MANVFKGKDARWGFWLGATTVMTLAFIQLGCLASPTSVAEGAVREGVGVELWASERCPSIGETVTLRAKVTNHSASVLVAELKDQPVLDIIITDKEGQHRWSDGKQLTPELTRLEVKPGESKIIEMQWVFKTLFGVSARFLPTPQYIDHPVAPFMVIGACSGFIGP